MIILPAPIRPDLDCIAGALAYAALLGRQGEIARVWCTGKPDGEAQFYLDKFPDFSFATDEEGRNAEAFVFVDFSEVFAMPDGFDPLRVREIIDHRFSPTVSTDFPNAKLQLDKVGAAATIIVERLKAADFRPSVALSAMLYGAIYSNTLCLRGALATFRDLQAANWLQEIAPDCDRYIGEQLQARTADILADVTGALFAETKLSDASRFGYYGFSQLEVSDGTGFWAAHGPVLMASMNAAPQPMVLNLIDLDGPTSLVYCSDQRFRSALPESFIADGSISRADPALMRKEIAPYFR